MLNLILYFFFFLSLRNSQQSADEMSENELPSMVDEAEESFMPISVISTSACQMREMSANDIERLIEDNKYLSKFQNYKKILNTYSLNEEFFKEDKNVRYYTGLTNKRILDITFDEVKTYVKSTVIRIIYHNFRTLSYL